MYNTTTVSLQEQKEEMEDLPKRCTLGEGDTESLEQCKGVGETEVGRD